MDARILSSFLILSITFAHAEASYETESLLDQGNEMQNMKGKPGSICSSCLEASRNAQTALNDLNMFRDIKWLSSEACHILPSELEYKCLDESVAYIHQAQFLLQELFHEKSLCISTGLCLDESILPQKNTLTSLINQSPETYESTCLDCNRAVKNIIRGVQTSRLRKKIMQIVVDQCEEEREGQSEKQCKQTLIKYASRILAKLEGLKANDLCQKMNFC